jgi:hypothetical protein
MLQYNLKEMYTEIIHCLNVALRRKSPEKQQFRLHEMQLRIGYW